MFLTTTRPDSLLFIMLRQPPTTGRLYDVLFGTTPNVPDDERLHIVRVLVQVPLL